MSEPANLNDAQKRDAVAHLNSTALLALQAQYGLTLPARSAHLWRPTLRSRGHLPGFDREFTILCTDGVVAWYVDHTDALFYGHVQHFTGDVKPLHSMPKADRPQDAAGKPRKARKKSKKLTLDDVLALLRSQPPQS